MLKALARVGGLLLVVESRSWGGPQADELGAKLHGKSAHAMEGPSTNCSRMSFDQYRWKWFVNIGDDIGCSTGEKQRDA